MDKKFLAVIVAIVVAFAGYMFLSKNDSGDSTTTTDTVVAGSNHALGAGNKKVTLTEYGDFQCPACAGYYQIVKQVKEKYGDDITFVYKNYPLDSIHPNARAGHRAAEAAAAQGKFFEMHDLLYENQTAWSTSSNVRSIFESYASQLQLDMTKYDEVFASKNTNEIINADIEEGKSKDVNSTPTFFLNGVLLNNDEIRSVEQFSAFIDAEIAKLNPVTVDTPETTVPSTE